MTDPPARPRRALMPGQDEAGRPLRDQPAPLRGIREMERNLRVRLSEQRTRSAWFPGPWSRTATERKLRQTFEKERDAAIAEYRRDWMPDDLAEAISRAATLVPQTPRTRDELRRVQGRPELVLDQLPDADLVRQFHAVSTDDVEAAVAEIIDFRARIAKAQPLVHPPANNDLPITDRHSEGGEIRPAGLDGRSLDHGVSVLRYQVHGDEGVVEKIRIAHEWQGLGLATRLLEALMATYPDVHTWWTTPQSTDGTALFAHVRRMHPSYGWRHLSERPQRAGPDRPK